MKLQQRATYQNDSESSVNISESWVNMDEDRDLSIEEILKEAEAVLARMEKKSKETIKEIQNVEEPIEISVHENEQEDVKAYVPSSENNGDKGNTKENIKIEDKDSEVNKEEKKQSEIEKTRVINAPQATIKIPASDRKFFERNANGQNFGKEPPQTIEKAATIKSKSRYDNTSDLQEIPTIMSVEELERTRVIVGGETNTKPEEKRKTDYEDSAQIRLNGFDDELENIPTVDEEEEERKLKKHREEKVANFRIVTENPENAEVNENTESAEDAEDEIYTNKRKKLKLVEKLFKKKTTYQAVMAITAFLGAFLLYLVLSRNTVSALVFLDTDEKYCIAVGIVYFVIMLVNINTIVHGFNFKHGINYDLPVSITCIFMLVHVVLIYLKPEMLTDAGGFFECSSVFLLFMSMNGKREMIVRLIDNFEFLTSAGDKYTVESIVNEVDASIIARNLLMGEPMLKYSIRTEMPTHFMKISVANEPANKISTVIFPCMIVLNAVLFGVMYFLNHNFEVSINIFIAGMAMSCPAFAFSASNCALKNVSRSTSSDNAMVTGFEGAHMLHNSNALVMEAADLFGSHSCDLHGIKTFNGAKIDDAILYTAAVIIKTKSPLAYEFNSIIVGNKSILPHVDDVLYEDKMGTSAWIYQKKILVGNRDLLIEHGVEIPSEEFEKKYTKNGRKALYLAVAGKVSAMFVVSYSATAKLKKELKKLERSGITILLKSSDPYINDESVKELFDLPNGFIRVMTSSNARIFEKYSEAKVKKNPAYALHDGSAIGFIKSIRASDTLVDVQSIIYVLTAFGYALGFAIVAFLGIANGWGRLSEINLLLYQIIWNFFIYIVIKLKTSTV